jgi:hypothetical protein
VAHIYESLYINQFMEDEMRELSQTEIESVNGGNILEVFKNIIVGGIGWDATKAVFNWAGDTFLARDGSSGSRYPIEDCERCS